MRLVLRREPNSALLPGNSGGGGGVNLTRVRSRGHSSAKAFIATSLTVGVFGFHVFTCTLTHLYVCFPLRAISEGHMLSLT